MAAAWTARSLGNLALTLAVAAVGGALGMLADLPAAWLSGAMIATTAAAFAGHDTRLPLRLVDADFLVIGLMLGAGVTPAVVSGLALWPLSLAGLLVSITACVIGVRAFLVRVAGWDRETAFFSSLPGALSYVLAVASFTSADMRKVAVSQSLRVFLLVAVLPPVIRAVEPGAATVPPLAVASPAGIAVMFAAGLVVAIVFRLIHAPAPLLVGGLAASAVLHGSGLVAGTLPAPAAVVAFVVLGALIGSRFGGTDLRFLRSVVIASVGAFIVATAIAGACAVAVAALIGAPLDQVIVAFAPGGLDAMTALALALHMDTAYVAAHQLARFVSIALALPLLSRILVTGGKDGSGKP